MSDEDKKPCDHAGCGCNVPISKDFCSESCRMAADSELGGSTCQCGHAECQQRR